MVLRTVSRRWTQWIGSDEEGLRTRLAVLAEQGPRAILQVLLCHAAVLGLFPSVMWRTGAWLLLPVALAQVAARMAWQRCVHQAQGVEALRRCALRFCAIRGLDGLVVGGLFLFISQQIMLQPQPQELDILIQVMALLMAGALLNSGVYPPAFVAVLLPEVLALVIHYVSRGGPQGYTMALFVALSAGLLLSISLRISAWIQEMLVLRVRNARLLGRIQTQRDAAVSAKQAAEVAHEAKSKFFAAASHDLRQPLCAMSLITSLLKQGLAGTPHADHVERLNRSVQALSGSLDAMLDVSRLDARTLVAQNRDLPVWELFRGVADAFGENARSRRVDLRIHAGSHRVHSDPQLLYRLVANLVDNALKYTPEGGVLLAARAQAGGVSIEVWDTGIGIGADEQQRIFEEFYQINNPGRDRALGLGIGLAIVQRLAGLLDVKVSLRSQVGKGSVFKVWVPAAVGNQSHWLDPLRPGGTGGEAAPDKVVPDQPLPPSVLLVDDDDAVRVALAEWLRSEGVEVHTAANMREAASLFLRQSPRVVIADLRLGHDQDGLHLLDTLQRLGTPVLHGVLLTGDTDPQLLERARQAGWPLLHKPADPAVIAQVLSAIWLSSLKGGAETDTARGMAA